MTKPIFKAGGSAGQPAALTINDDGSASILDATGASIFAVSSTGAVTALQPDTLVVPVITMGTTPSGGATDSTISIQLKKADGVTNIASARQIQIIANTVAYRGDASLSSTITFGTATAGAKIATAAGWCLAQTDATGLFAGAISNSADETLYFTVITAPSVSTLSENAVVLPGLHKPLTWSA